MRLNRIRRFHYDFFVRNSYFNKKKKSNREKTRIRNNVWPPFFSIRNRVWFFMIENRLLCRWRDGTESNLLCFFFLEENSITNTWLHASRETAKSHSSYKYKSGNTTKHKIYINKYAIDFFSSKYIDLDFGFCYLLNLRHFISKPIAFVAWNAIFIHDSIGLVRCALNIVLL